MMSMRDEIAFDAVALRAGVGEEAAPAALDAAVMRDDLAGALDRFDEPRAQGILDRLLERPSGPPHSERTSAR
jgi:hypothetical protein